jgi:hypothetical protein
VFLRRNISTFRPSKLQLPRKNMFHDSIVLPYLGRERTTLLQQILKYTKTKVLSLSMKGTDFRSRDIWSGVSFFYMKKAPRVEFHPCGSNPSKLKRILVRAACGGRPCHGARFTQVSNMVSIWLYFNWLRFNQPHIQGVLERQWQRTIPCEGGWFFHWSDDYMLEWSCGVISMFLEFISRYLTSD